MFTNNAIRQFLVRITILIPFVFIGATFAGTPNNDLNADLIKASFSGNIPEVERLLAKGADVNTMRVDGITALMGASFEGHKEIVKLLLAKGVDVNVKAKNFGRNGNDATACNLASQEGYQEIVEMLVKAGCILEEKAKTQESNRPPRKRRSQQ